MKLAILTPEYPPTPGGVSVSVARIGTSLARLGHEVSILIPQLSPQRRSTPALLVNNSAGYRIVEVFVSDSRKDASVPEWALSKLGRLPQAYVALRRFLRDWRPDVLHSFTLFPYGILTGLLAHDLAIPYIVGIRGSDLQSNIFRPDVVAALELSCRSAAMIVAVASDIASQVSFLVPATEHKVRVILNGIDVPPFAPRHVVSESRAADDVVFGTVGVFRPKKNIEQLIDAFRVFRSGGGAGRLRLVGASHSGDIPTALDLPPEAADSIDVVGPIAHSDVASAMQRLDVFVLTSVFDGCPNALLEAMRAERAIIASSVGGNRDLIRHGVNGLLFDPLDTAALVDCMRKMLDPAFRVRLGTEAGLSVRPAEVEAKEWEKAYEQAILGSARNHTTARNSRTGTEDSRAMS